MPARAAPARKLPASFRALWLAVSALWLVPAAQAFEPETYAIDPVHTRVLFAIGHAGFSKAMGTVSGSTGTLVFDRDDWSHARLDVRVPLERLDMGDAKWNDAVRAGNLLDTKRHPDAHFVSTKIEPVDADHAKVCGDLTLRGVTRPACMDATLNRAEFGMTAWPTVIGDAVELRIEAEAQRARGDSQSPDASTPDEPAAPTEPSTSEPEPQIPPEPTP